MCDAFIDKEDRLVINVIYIKLSMKNSMELSSLSFSSSRSRTGNEHLPSTRNNLVGEHQHAISEQLPVASVNRDRRRLQIGCRV